MSPTRSRGLPEPIFGYLPSPNGPPLVNLSGQPMGEKWQNRVALVYAAADVVMRAVAATEEGNVPREDVLILVADARDEWGGRRVIRRLAFWRRSVEQTEAMLQAGYHIMVAPMRRQFARKIFAEDPPALEFLATPVPVGACRIIGAADGGCVMLHMPVVPAPKPVGDA